MIGIRTHDLRKTYHSAPPFGAGGAGFGPPPAGGKKNKQPKPEIAALDGLSLDIFPGEVFGLLGPNGAGKSTTVGILTTRVRPSGGQAWRLTLFASDWRSLITAATSRWARLLS